MNVACLLGPRQHLTWDMLYRYCSMIFILPGENQWALFPLSESNEQIGNPISQDSRGRVSPGNYLVLGLQSPYGTPLCLTWLISIDKAEIEVDLTTERPPRRVLTQDRSPDSLSQGRTERDRLVGCPKISKTRAPA